MRASFFDSNALLYLLSDDARADRIEGLLREGGTISVQVLNEVLNVARRKFGLPWPAVIGFLDDLRGLLTVVPNDLAAHDTGLAVAERYRLSVWDSMIVGAALNADCDRLYSEDMQHGLVVDSRLTIVNPFA